MIRGSLIEIVGGLRRNSKPKDLCMWNPAPRTYERAYDYTAGVGGALRRHARCDTFRSITHFGVAGEKTMALIVVLILIGGAVLILAGMYNSLVKLRVGADSAWSDIDVQLKRRHDLIPNLVETAKGYAAHEKGTFENIAKFRSQAMQATSPADKAQAENELGAARKSLCALAENY